MFKIACLTFAAILGGATLAQAQTTYYYGSTGGSQGSSTTSGNTTYYYGSNGGSQGSATRR